MGRPKSDTPKLRRQRGSLRSDGSRARDRAFIELDGRRVYLGDWDTREAKGAYFRVLAERHAGLAPPSLTSSLATRETGDSECPDLTIVELVDRFETWLAERHQQGRIADPDRYGPALTPLTDLYGLKRVADFRPKHLLAVQQAFVAKKWQTRTINMRFGFVKRVFRWGISRGYTTPEQVFGLTQVESVEPAFDEHEPVMPAAMEHVEKVRPLVSRQVRAMIDLQLATGARPGEICIMRPADIQTAKDPWEYVPTRHKNQRRGKSRVILLGPKARDIIAPFLGGRRTDAFLFSPSEAERERRERVHAERTTPMSCGNRPGTNRRDNPEREPGERYRTTSYARAVRRACEDAGIPVWTPNQLRHTFATRLRAEVGLDVTSTLLGHSKVETTQVYAEQNHAKAREVARRIG